MSASLAAVCLLMSASLVISNRIMDMAQVNSHAPTKSEEAPSFRGGHAENQVINMDACEFSKTHDGGVYERFEVERDFLKMAVNDSLWSPLVPAFRRLDIIDGKEYIVLENTLCHVRKPVIADFKLGTQSWAPGAPEEKMAKMDIRDRASTTKELGVRVVSAQLPKFPTRAQLPLSAREWQLAGRKAVKSGLTEEPGSAWLGAQTPEAFARVLDTFLPTAPLRAKFVQELQPFLRAFRTQTTYRFTGVSLFVWYDAEDMHTDEPTLGMKIIDFPHTQGAGLGSVDEEAGVIDIGVLTGLKALQTMIVGPNKPLCSDPWSA